MSAKDNPLVLDNYSVGKSDPTQQWSLGANLALGTSLAGYTLYTEAVMLGAAIQPSAPSPLMLAPYNGDKMLQFCWTLWEAGVDEDFGGQLWTVRTYDMNLAITSAACAEGSDLFALPWNDNDNCQKWRIAPGWYAEEMARQFKK